MSTTDNYSAVKMQVSESCLLGATGNAGESLTHDWKLQIWNRPNGRKIQHLKMWE